MAADLGSTTYVSVTWTTGDLITEAKLDNMVANDQAYDSHAAQGLLLNNNKSFAGKNAAGSTNLNVAKVTASDVIQIGEDNVGDHTVINAGTSKLVKLKVLRQDNTTNTYTKDSVLLTGWGYLDVSSVNTANETITFGITFAEKPIVILNASSVSNSAPSDVGTASLGPDNEAKTWAAAPRNITTTTFVVGIAANSAFAASKFFSYTWLAIGRL